MLIYASELTYKSERLARVVLSYLNQCYNVIL